MSDGPAGDRRSDAQLEASILDAAPVSIFRLERSGRVSSWNPGSKRLFGYDAAEIVGRHVRYLLDPVHADALLAADSHDSELACRAKGGGIVKIALRASAIEDSSGDSVALVCVCRELGPSDESILRALEATPCAMLVVDEQGILRLTNRSLEGLLGYRREQLVGQSIDSLVPPRYRSAGRPNVRSALVASLRAMAPGSEIRVQHQDGREVPVQVSPSTLEVVGDVHVLLALVDVRERLRMREAVDRYTAELTSMRESLDSFVNVAVHDLRAPLRGIRNLAEWIEEDTRGELDEECREHLATMRSRILHMDRMLSDLLRFAAAGSDGGEVESVPLVELVEQVGDLLAPPESFQLQVLSDVTEIRARRSLLQRVLINLIGNCIQHHDRSDPHVYVRARVVGGAVEIAVEDDGPGIAPEDRERVCDPLRILRPRGEADGSGIGLTLVRKLVQAEGGKVWIEPMPGRGTRVAFTWPTQAGYVPEPRTSELGRPGSRGA